MTASPRGAGWCVSCSHKTTQWLTYFCPICGAHHDHLYILQAPDPRPRSREVIIHEYRVVGMTAEAIHLAAEPVTEPAAA